MLNPLNNITHFVSGQFLSLENKVGRLAAAIHRVARDRISALKQTATEVKNHCYLVITETCSGLVAFIRSYFNPKPPEPLQVVTAPPVIEEDVFYDPIGVLDSEEAEEVFFDAEEGIEIERSETPYLDVEDSGFHFEQEKLDSLDLDPRVQEEIQQFRSFIGFKEMAQNAGTPEQVTTLWNRVQNEYICRKADFLYALTEGECRALHPFLFLFPHLKSQFADFLKKEREGESITSLKSLLISSMEILKTWDHPTLIRHLQAFVKDHQIELLQHAAKEGEFALFFMTTFLKMTMEDPEGVAKVLEERLKAPFGDGKLFQWVSLSFIKLLQYFHRKNPAEATILLKYRLEMASKAASSFFLQEMIGNLGVFLEDTEPSHIQEILNFIYEAYEDGAITQYLDSSPVVYSLLGNFLRLIKTLTGNQIPPLIIKKLQDQLFQAFPVLEAKLTRRFTKLTLSSYPIEEIAIVQKCILEAMKEQSSPDELADPRDWIDFMAAIKAERNETQLRSLLEKIEDHVFGFIQAPEAFIQQERAKRTQNQQPLDCENPTIVAYKTISEAIDKVSRYKAAAFKDKIRTEVDEIISTSQSKFIDLIQSMFEIPMRPPQEMLQTVIQSTLFDLAIKEHLKKWIVKPTLLGGWISRGKILSEYEQSQFFILLDQLIDPGLDPQTREKKEQKLTNLLGERSFVEAINQWRSRLDPVSISEIHEMLGQPLTDFERRDLARKYAVKVLEYSEDPGISKHFDQIFKASMQLAKEIGLKEAIHPDWSEIIMASLEGLTPKDFSGFLKDFLNSNLCIKLLKSEAPDLNLALGDIPDITYWLTRLLRLFIPLRSVPGVVGQAISSIRQALQSQ